MIYTAEKLVLLCAYIMCGNDVHMAVNQPCMRACTFAAINGPVARNYISNGMSITRDVTSGLLTCMATVLLFCVPLP